MSIHDQDHGDYVLVHKSKAKISRARKGIIGMMAVGAIAALAGAGTFASFSASTTNDGVFRTGYLELSNKVNSGTPCLSSDLGPGNTATADANLDENDTTCNDIFSANLRPGVLATATLTIKNSSTYQNGKLFLFGTDDTSSGTTNVCASVVNDASFRGGLKGTGNICDVVQMTIQETQSDFSTNVTCVFPVAGSCPALTNTLNTSAQLSDFPWNYAAGSPRDLGAINTNVNSGERYFVVSVWMRDEGFFATGVGKDNKYQNLKPSMKLRWLLQDA